MSSESTPLPPRVLDTSNHHTKYTTCTDTTRTATTAAIIAPCGIGDSIQQRRLRLEPLFFFLFIFIYIVLITIFRSVHPRRIDHHQHYHQQQGTPPLQLMKEKKMRAEAQTAWTVVWTIRMFFFLLFLLLILNYIQIDASRTRQRSTTAYHHLQGLETRMRFDPLNVCFFF